LDLISSSLSALMWNEFILENVHFTVNCFAALVFFAIFWLYLDAWQIKKVSYLAFRMISFAVLAISFMFSGVAIESSILQVGLTKGITENTASVLQLIGYLILIASLFIEPIESRPNDKKGHQLLIIAIPTLTALNYFPVFMPILTVIIAYLYLKRSTIGLENHIKPVALGFYLLSLSNLAGMAVIFRKSIDIRLYSLVAPFGTAWIVEHALLVFTMMVLGKWVFTYLFKQFQTQLFMIFTCIILVIYLLTTVTFTGLLVNNIREESMNQLKINVKVLEYVFDSKRSEILSNAQMYAQNPDMIAALERADKKLIGDYLARYILAKNESSLVVTNDSGQVLGRGEDRERIGDSISSDSLVRRALLGDSVTSVITSDGVLSPVMSIKAAAPVVSGTKTLGTIITGSILDMAFVDGIKKSTGLDAMIYAGNKISAGTVTSPDGKIRLVGITEENQMVKENVLNKGLSYAGPVFLNNISYLAAYDPIKDTDGNTVGMLFIGKPEFSILMAAGRSIELTFITTAILLVISVFPAYLISRFISIQIH
jgi:hypothetical protein